MKYQDLDVLTWESLELPDKRSGGYPSIVISDKTQDNHTLHIFKDAAGKAHFAIETPEIEPNDIEDPRVNGLKIKVTEYKFYDGDVKRFIDFTCNISSYIAEFTEVVKEISKAILDDGKKSLNAVNSVINNWVSFWGHLKKESLSEEEQVGLICELIVLNMLCKNNSRKALDSWTGPLNEKHDFSFSRWNFEVKGTRNATRTHRINGIDQLKAPFNKRLAFVSFQLVTSKNSNSISLPDIIDLLIETNFKEKPDQIISFNELLSSSGYSPIFRDEYERFRVEVIHSSFYEVNADFPVLTSDNLTSPLAPSISSVQYQITLSGLEGVELNDLDLSNYYW